MLVEKLNNKIITIKLISGEEIMAECVDSSSSSLTIKNPMMMALNEIKDTSQVMITFFPWAISISNKMSIVLELSKIITYGTSRDDAAEQYRKTIEDSKL